MTRFITSHAVNPANELIAIKVLDESGAGGANHHYSVYSLDSPAFTPTFLQFQNGPIKEAGVNGITHEVLLAIVADRLEGFQQGPYACKENEFALLCVHAAMSALKQRTLERMERGVEGTHEL